MSEKNANIVAQYVRKVHALAHVRPYENRLPLSNEVTGNLAFEQLPEEGHWRVELTLTVNSVNSEGVLCFETSCTLEAIALLEGLVEAEVRPVLTHTIAGLMIGHVRAALTNASLATGYGPTMLPPMTGSQLAALANLS